MKLCWLDIRNCGAMTDAVRAEAVHQRIDAIVAADPADLEGLPPTVTKVLMPGAAGLPADLGAADIVIVDANRPQDYAALAARPNGVRPVRGGDRPGVARTGLSLRGYRRLDGAGLP